MKDKEREIMGTTYWVVEEGDVLYASLKYTYQDFYERMKKEGKLEKHREYIMRKRIKEAVRKIELEYERRIEQRGEKYLLSFEDKNIEQQFFALHEKKQELETEMDYYGTQPQDLMQKIQDLQDQIAELQKHAKEPDYFGGL